MGQPRDGDWHASYCIFSPYERIAGNCAASSTTSSTAQDKIVAAGLPQRLAQIAWRWASKADTVGPITSRTPTLWAQADAATRAALGVQRLIERELRGTLLLNVQDILKDMANEPVIYLIGKGVAAEHVIDEVDDEAFDMEVSVCLRVNSAVLVAVGAYMGPSLAQTFWTGYLRDGELRHQTEAEEAVLEEARLRFVKKITGTNPPWYIWSWNRETTYNNCHDEATALRLANLLLRMKESLTERINLM